MVLLIKKLQPTAIVPKQATAGSAGIDLPLAEGCLLAPGETKVLSTGLAMAIPKGFVGLILARSSAFKSGLNVTGVVDSDYRGPVKVMIQNVSNVAWPLSVGSCYAQMLLVQYGSPAIVEVESLDATERGDGGFGSTGNTTLK